MNDSTDQSLEILNHMINDPLSPDPNLICFNIVINTCFKNNQNYQFNLILDMMLKRGKYMVKRPLKWHGDKHIRNNLKKGKVVLPNEVTFNTIMYWLNLKRNHKETLKYYDLSKSFRNGYHGTDIILNSALNASSRLGDYTKSHEIINDMIKSNIKPNNMKYTYLLQSYMKTKQYEKALEIFKTSFESKKETSSHEKKNENNDKKNEDKLCDDNLIMKKNEIIVINEYVQNVKMLNALIRCYDGHNKIKDNIQYKMFFKEIMSLMETYKIIPNVNVLSSLANICNYTQQPYNESLKIIELAHINNIKINFNIYKEILENLERHQMGELSLSYTTEGIDEGAITLYNEEDNILNLNLQSQLFSKAMIRYLLQLFIKKYDYKFKDCIIICGKGNLKPAIKKYLKDANFTDVYDYEEESKFAGINDRFQINNEINNKEFNIDDGSKIDKNRCLLLTSKSIEKFIYFNAFEEPALLRMLPKWIYF